MLAIFYRMTGGFVSLDGTFATRLRWALFMALCMAYAGAVHGFTIPNIATVFLATILSAYLGRLIPHGPFMDSAKKRDCLFMGLIGMGRLALLLAPFCYFHPVALALAPFGLLSGLAYYVGWKCLDGKDSGLYFKDQVFAKGGGEWGEVLTGALAYELPFWVLLAL